MKINLTRLDKDAVEPKRRYPSDAGLDLFSLQEVIIQPQEMIAVPVGWRMVIPLHENCFAWNTNTFSSSSKGLIVLPGIIDPGYFGDCGPLIFNLSKFERVILPGDKVSQLVFLSRVQIELTEAAVCQRPVRTEKLSHDSTLPKLPIS